MLVSAAEPILQVTSNSLFAFVFCNLIAFVIFLGTKFGSNDAGTRDVMPVFGVHHDVKQAEIDDIERFSSDQIVRSSTDDNENKNENEEDDGEEVNDDEDDNGDDELRRRIEDFIAKVNREWQAENLKERMHQLTLLDSTDANRCTKSMTSIFQGQCNFKS